MKSEQGDITRPRKATGPDRPVYFNAGDIDRVMAILLALVSEVAAMRDRIDTHERLAGAGIPPTLEMPHVTLGAMRISGVYSGLLPKMSRHCGLGNSRGQAILLFATSPSWRSQNAAAGFVVVPTG
jgi:hypothetical protein